MKLKKAEIESFGKLENKTIEFDEKITLILGENEAGKSTLATFLKYMLYGFSGKAASVSANEKKKYTPWNGAKAAGALTVECQGELFRIERESAQRNAAKILDGAGNLRFAGMAAGEAFLKVDSDTFGKTAFIGQLDITADKMDGLAGAIQNILFSADESVSADTAKKKLSSYRNTLYNRLRKTGRIFELESRLESLEQKKNMFLSKHKELLIAEFSLEETRKNSEENREKLRGLAVEKGEIEAYLAAQKQQEISRAQQRVRRAREYLDGARERAQHHGFFPSGEETEALSVLFSKLCSLTRRIEIAEKSLCQAKQEYGAAYEGNDKLQTLARRSLERNTPLDAAVVLSTLDRLKRAYRSNRTLAILFAVLIVTIPLSFLFRARAKKANAEIAALLSGYDCADENELRELMIAYPAAAAFAEQSAFRYESALSQLQTEKEAYAEEESRAAALLEKVGAPALPGGEITEKIKAAIGKLKADLSYYEEKNAAYSVAKTEYDTLVRENDLVKLEERARKYQGRVPDREIAVVDREILYYETQRTGLAEREIILDKQTGILTSTLPKPSEIESEMNLIRDKLDALRLKSDAFELAMTAIDEACDEIKNKVSPGLTERASALFYRLTGGKYRSLTVNSDMALSFLEGDGSVLTREVDFLSAGAVDLAYLSLRIALADYLYTEKPPLIFDDAFVKVDDGRLDKLLDVLCELGEEYQIILFCCHEREAKKLRGRAKIITI